MIEEIESWQIPHMDCQFEDCPIRFKVRHEHADGDPFTANVVAYEDAKPSPPVRVSWIRAMLDRIKGMIQP